jgi:hypothetical protein
MTGPDPKLGAKISLAGRARKRRVEMVWNAATAILH